MSRFVMTSIFVSVVAFGGLAPVSGAECVGEQCNIYRGAEYYGVPHPKSQRQIYEENLPAKDRNALMLMREKSRLRQKEMERQADIKRAAENTRQFNRAMEQEKARKQAVQLQEMRQRAQRQRARSNAARASQQKRRRRVFRQNRRHDRHPTIICSTVGGMTICQ